MKVDFATFCHRGDAHRLHAPGQLKRQVESNNYTFDDIIIVYQGVPDSDDLFYYLKNTCQISVKGQMLYSAFQDIDSKLTACGIDINKPQYVSSTDKAHSWKGHVVNHLVAADIANVPKPKRTDYIVFADNDCWMVRQPAGRSWIIHGIRLLETYPDIFIVSPNDGEPERVTQRFSQQMFLARVDEFRNADFNQPGWDGNVNIPGGPMPEYWGMLEGRMELYCRTTGQYRYVLGPEYRYWHWNRLTQDGLLETDMSKY